MIADFKYKSLVFPLFCISMLIPFRLWKRTQNNMKWSVVGCHGSYGCIVLHINKKQYAQYLFITFIILLIMPLHRGTSMHIWVDVIKIKLVLSRWFLRIQIILGYQFGISVIIACQNSSSTSGWNWLYVLFSICSYIHRVCCWAWCCSWDHNWASIAIFCCYPNS